MDPREDSVRDLLNRLRNGESHVEGELYALIYQDLHRIAAKLMRDQRRNHTLQATALVREAYLRLRRNPENIADFRHYLAIAARAMRQVLVDHARHRNAQRTGGNLERVELEAVMLSTDPHEGVINILDLHDALDKLEADDPVAARLVELRFFAGVDMAEIATMLAISERTCHRLWATTRAWLRRALFDHS